MTGLMVAVAVILAILFLLALGNLVERDRKIRRLSQENSRLRLFTALKTNNLPLHEVERTLGITETANI